MYTQDFYITEAVWNNAFSFSERHNKKLFVPKLKKIEHVDEIELYEANEEKITFEEYDFDGNMQTCFGLKNLYEIDWRWKKIFLVDNHNHVFYFWYLARNQGIISDGTLLYHIDEHADTRDPEKYLQKEEYKDLQKVFEYTNFALNVGNYIIPAQKEWLISEVVQIRGEGALKEYLEKQQVKYIHLSVSHVKEMANAMVVMEKWLGLFLILQKKFRCLFYAFFNWSKFKINSFPDFYIGILIWLIGRFCCFLGNTWFFTCD